MDYFLCLVYHAVKFFVSDQIFREQYLGECLLSIGRHQKSKEDFWCLFLLFKKQNKIVLTSRQSFIESIGEEEQPISSACRYWLQYIWYIKKHKQQITIRFLYRSRKPVNLQAFQRKPWELLWRRIPSWYELGEETWLIRKNFSNGLIGSLERF